VIGINLQNATEGYTGKYTNGSVGRTSCASKLFGGFAKHTLLVILEQNGSHALAPFFKQTEGEEGGGGGGLQEEGGNYLWELVFYMCEFGRIVSWLALG
jgi:hypothetical protein